MAALSQRESKILHFLALGATNRQIARDLGIFEGDVNAHLRRLVVKLCVENRSQAREWACEHASALAITRPRQS
jgi:DNA-binding NarL/FixJ family response regulator